jgi:hypothetical protein
LIQFCFPWMSYRKKEFWSGNEVSSDFMPRAPLYEMPELRYISFQPPKFSLNNGTRSKWLFLSAWVSLIWETTDGSSARTQHEEGKVDIHCIEKKWSEYKLSGITNQNCVHDEINRLNFESSCRSSIQNYLFIFPCERGAVCARVWVRAVVWPPQLFIRRINVTTVKQCLSS